MEENKKYVYLFQEGNAKMKDILGGKGANLAEMTNLGLPIPQGFTISAECCNKYYEDGEKISEDIISQIEKALGKLEEMSGKKFGDVQKPLLVSVRSGARVSMPGMMDTILNLGINDETVKTLAAKNRRFAYDSYRRFIQMFSDVAMEVPKYKFENVLDRYKEENNFKFEIIPLTIGGFVVIKSTVLATIKKRKVTAGLLVVLALIGTTYVGEYLSGSIVSFMMIFGEFLEDLTMKKTQNAVRSLIQLVPHKCRKKIGNKFEQVSIREVRPGDIIQVIAGEKIPVDGIIQNGQSTINEAAITGESMPVDKTKNDKVFVGTLNENGVIEILTEKIGNETILGQIIKTVKNSLV